MNDEKSHKQCIDLVRNASQEQLNELHAILVSAGGRQPARQAQRQAPPPPTDQAEAPPPPK
jgi:hypothetical protein